MPLAEYLEGQKPEQPPTAPKNNAAKLRKQVFLQGGVMIALGLLLAGWYVGYRVVTTRSHQPAPVKVTQDVPKKIAAAPQPTPQPAESKPVPLSTPVVPVAPIAKPAPANQPPAPSHQPPAPSRQPPATINQPPATINQPPATSNQPPATSTQPPATSHQHPATSRQPLATKFARHEASPRTGEKYLQIAAFGPRALDGFLKTLEGQGLHPLVAPGPVDNIYRILVGPFPNSTALEEARTLIKASGVEPILRTY